MSDHVRSPKAFQVRGIHPQVFIGTASDRYAGWIGQIYSRDRYEGQITKRSRIVAGRPITEEVLPVDSVQEYFAHFSVLEIDFTFYRPLLDQDGQPSQNYQVLQNYSRYLKDGDRIILKVPQMTTAQKIHRGEQYLENEAYLNPKIFAAQFYDPAVKLLGQNLTGFIFEKEYQRKEDRPAVTELARDLDKFFQAIPRDKRYHLELRTDLYLRDPVFEILAKHGVGQILSQWTWLPPLRKQLAKASGRFFNAGNQCVIRLLTSLGMRYADSYLKAHPFDRLIEGMLQPEMVLETVEIMRQAVEKGITVNVIVNNRAGGNAPLIAQEIVRRFLPNPKPLAGHQLNLWDLK
jgi:uncharacterized protein YecE (DUF72 family)